MFLTWLKPAMHWMQWLLVTSEWEENEFEQVPTDILDALFNI